MSRSNDAGGSGVGDCRVAESTKPETDNGRERWERGGKVGGYERWGGIARYFPSSHPAE